MYQNDPSKLKRKFSSFFKSLVIELDKDLYGPDNHLVEWHRTPTTQETDGFQVSLYYYDIGNISANGLFTCPPPCQCHKTQILKLISANLQFHEKLIHPESRIELFVLQVKRPGDKNVRCTILLLLDYQPHQFKLDPRLARLLGVHTQTRPVIITALWQYIKTHKLQDSHEREYINCDKYLEQVSRLHSCASSCELLLIDEKSWVT